MSLRDLITSIKIDYQDGKLKAVNADVGKAKAAMEGLATKADMVGRRFGQAFTFAKIAVGGFLASKALRMVTTEYAAQADASIKTAQGLGMTVEEYTQLAHASNLSGLKIEQVGTAVGKLARRAAEAAAGSTEAKKSWKDLGVEVTGAGGKLKTPIQLLEDTADAFAKLPDGTKKTALALKFFEESGAKFVPFLNEGSKGIRAMMVEADKLGISLKTKDAKAAEAFSKEMLRVRSVFVGIRNQIGSALLPILTRGMKAFQEWAKEGDNLKNALEDLKTVAKVVGAALGLLVVQKVAGWAMGAARAVMGLAAALRAAGMAGAAAQAKMILLLGAGLAIAGLIDDLHGFISGDRSSAIELLFGSPEEAQAVRAMMIAVGAELQATFAELAPALKELGKALWDLFKMLWKDVVKPLLPYLITGLKWAVKALTVWIGLVVKLVTYALIKPIKWMLPYVVKLISWLGPILVAVFRPVVKVVGWLFDAVTWGVEKLQAAWRWVADSIGGFITGIADWFRDMWDGLVAWLEKAWETLSAPFKWAADKAREAWNTVVDKIKEAYEWAAKTAKKSVKWVKEKGKEAYDYGTGSITDDLPTIGIGSLLPAIPPGFGPSGAAPAPGGSSRTNNVSINGLTLALQNPTSMTPAELQRITAEGLVGALRDVLQRTNDHRGL